MAREVALPRSHPGYVWVFGQPFVLLSGSALIISDVRSVFVHQQELGELPEAVRIRANSFACSRNSR